MRWCRKTEPGESSKALAMDGYVPFHYVLKNADVAQLVIRIVTAGIGGVFPSTGVPLGIVSVVRRKAAGHVSGDR
jgi:cell shape-determining protein MreC